MGDFKSKDEALTYERLVVILGNLLRFYEFAGLKPCPTKNPS